MFVTSTINEDLYPESFANLKTYKKTFKEMLLVKQKRYSIDEWGNDNCLYKYL